MVGANWSVVGGKWSVVGGMVGGRWIYTTPKKGGFIAKRHDNIKGFRTVLLNKVCHDVQSEPQLIPVTNEHMRLRTANTNDQSRLDIKARGFWRRGKQHSYACKLPEQQKPRNTCYIPETRKL